MRLRYLAVDYFQEASRSARVEYLRYVLPVPNVTSLEERFDALSKLDGVASSCHRNIFGSSSPKISLELPRDSPCLGETNIYDKFLSEIFPGKLPRQPSIDSGAGVVGSESVHWLCSDTERIKLQIQEEDDNMICSDSQTVATSDIPEVTAPKSIISAEVPHLSCSGQSTFGQHMKEQKPGSAVFELLEIEPPQLELRDCIPQPEHVWSRIILGLGGAPVEPNVGVTLRKVNAPKAWFDISPLPCFPEHWKNKSTAVEARFNDIQEIQRIDKALRSRRYPDKINDLVAKIMPIEIRMIPEKVNWQHRGQKEMTYPLEPTCLVQWFESHEDSMAKEAHNLPIGDFNTKMTLEDVLTSKVGYREEYTQPAMLLPGLVCEQRDPQPCCTSVMDSATNPLQCIKLTFEIPRTCDWSLSSLANTTPGIITAHESETLAPDLPRLLPSQSFESAVVIPELILDDQQFQSLPVPVVTCPQEYMMDAELGRLVSVNCEPSTVPATDWLYLDWHFFHGLKCTNAECFSLQARLSEEEQCGPLPSTLMTTEVVTSQKCSKLVLELRLLEDHDFHQDSCDISHTIGTIHEKIEARLGSPVPEVSQIRCKQYYQPPLETQNPQGRECKSLLQVHCVDFPTDIDSIAENGFLPASHGSNLLQNHCARGVEGGKVDLNVQAVNYNYPDPGGKPRTHLQNMQPVERSGTGEPDSIHTVNEGRDLHRKSHAGETSNNPGSRRELSLRAIRSGSDSMANDFDFFVRARKGIPVTGTSPQSIMNPTENSYTVVNEPALSTTCESDDQHNTTTPAAFCEHEIEISMEIRNCLVSLSSNYFALLAMEEISELETPGELNVLKQFGFDSDGNSRLTSLISSMADEPASRQRQILLRGLIAFHVLRHTALNLCNYGIQVAHLYLENCFERMQFLEGYIMSSRTELEEAYDQVERGVMVDHPKLGYLDKLLGPVALEIHRAKYLSTRILVLADRRAFFTLVRKLVSLGLTPYQIDRKENYLHDGVLQEDSQGKLKDEILEALTFSDCLLVSYAYVSPSFPVQRFTMIIQYADSPYTGATSSSWTKGIYEIHFFKALVHPEEFQMKCSNSSSHRKADCQDAQEHNLSGSIPLLKPNPAVGRSADKSQSQSITLNQNVPRTKYEPATHSSSGGEKEQIMEENCSCERRCEMIIIANISNPNDYMLTGRRSSYQKILHLEKENLQVVERELRLPVDLILSPACCLVVYTLGKLNLEPHNLKDKQGTLQIEVVTHLKAISFSFSDCIMIFEGPTEFTTAALEISTQIYTLAIALQIQFQCFASRHPEVTDRIVMHSIQAVRKSKHMPSYPIMTEGPTLAEVFLTGFPSINPLTAHAILSSGCSLPLFMSYAPEQQFAAVEPYEVPKRCLELFKAQCTYKAITTAVLDCKGIEAPDQPDVEIPYQHQADSLAVGVDVPNLVPRPEVWTSFPEFPPACAISGDSPTYNVRDANPISSFPDFPPVSEISSQAEDQEGNQPSSTDLDRVLDILKHSPAEAATWPLNPLDRDDVSTYERAPQKNSAQEMYAQNDIQWFSKGSGSANFGSGRFPNGLQNNFQMPLNPSAAQCEVQDHPFELEKRHWPWITSAPANGSKRLGGVPENLHGGYEILQDSEEPMPRPQLGMKRGASSFSFISPTVYGGRQEKGLNNVSWNDHKRVRGVTSGFMAETFDLQDIDGPFASKLPTGPDDIDELPPVRPDWIENSPLVHEETNVLPRSRQSRKPQATLKASSLDRFRYQSRSPAPGTGSNSYTQTTIKFPTIKFPRTAPRRSRTQSPSITYLPLAVAGKPTVAKKTLSEFAADKRPRAILGVARRGSDTQQRLVWKTNPSSSSSKRQKIS